MWWQLNYQGRDVWQPVPGAWWSDNEDGADAVLLALDKLDDLRVLFPGDRFTLVCGRLV